MTFAYPWILLLLPCAVLLYLMTKKETRSVATASSELLHAAPRSLRAVIRTPLLATLYWSTLILLTIGAARPQKSEVVSTNVESRNLMLVLDISKSMEADDFDTASGAIARIDAVKRVVSEFIKARTDDRVGVVVFGSNAYLQAPLTQDHDLVTSLVENLEAGLAGNGTAIGEGLGLGLKRIADVPSTTRAVILLTDGSNNSGRVAPLQAAKIAKDLGIKVHTIGIGSSEVRAPQQMRDLLFGGAQGAEFDEKTLKTIAETTGGVYFNASNLEKLQGVYDEIDKLERSESETILPKRIHELFPPLAWGALLTGAILLLLSSTLFLKVP